jgi:MoaA/NifB/PqqE/SkfB family radical SAM enzyme
MLIADVLPGLDVLELQGTGESLLSTRIKDFINAAIANNTEGTLITNGSLLDDDIMRLLVMVGTQLVISLDGSNETLYAMHRPVGSFNKVIENIERLNRIRQSGTATGFSLVVNMVLTKLNRNDIPDMIDMLSKLKADYLFVSEVRKCMPDSAVWGNLNLLAESSSSEFNAMIEDCKLLAKKKGIGFGFNPNTKPGGIKKTICESPWKHVFVSANGDVSVCCELGMVFGNLYKQNLTEILNGESLLKFQSDMLNGNYDNHCLSCCLPWGLPYSSEPSMNKEIK